VREVRAGVPMVRMMEPPTTVPRKVRTRRPRRRRGAGPPHGFSGDRRTPGVAPGSGRCRVNSPEQVPPNESAPPTPAAARTEGPGPEVPPEKWQALEAQWKAILGLEAALETVRLGLDGLRAEMEAAFRQSLRLEEKLHALQADVVQWNKARSRVHYALPKVREFLHRATWAAAVPERKRLEELFKGHVEPRVPFPQVEDFREGLEHLQKDRQVLIAQGNSVSQECRGILAEIRRALGTLQRNAADRARQKRSAGHEKGKHF
jgi:hypothetical protein